MPQSLPGGSTPISQRIPLTAKQYIWLPALILLLLVFQRSAAADTLYTYTGNDFTSFDAPAGYPTNLSTSEHVFVSFTITGPPLVCLTLCSISPNDLSLSVEGPGVAIFSADIQLAMVQTDSSGAIVAWEFGGCIDLCEDRHISTANVPGGIGDGAIYGNAIVSNFNDPGVWTMTTISPVPEPTTFATFASGLALLAGVIRRRGTSSSKLAQSGYIHSKR
jgi:hypothetical protein